MGRKEKMLYILWGDDDYSLRESLAEIKKGLAGGTGLFADIAVIDGETMTLEQLRNIVATLPFLAEKRLVVVDGLLGRFEARGKPRGKSSPKSHGDNVSALAECFKNLPESTVLVLVENVATKDNPLLAEIAAKATVKPFPRIRDAQKLKMWILVRVAKGGGTISPPAADLLARLVGGNLWLMASEIEKLVLYAAGGRIEEADVTLMVNSAQEATIFNLVDAVMDSGSGVAMQSLQQLLRGGAAPAYILTMIARQMRLMVRVRDMREQGCSDTEIQNRLGLAEFAWRRTAGQAQRYSLARIKDAYGRLLEADLAIKTGKYDGEVALDVLVSELCQRSAV
jgi:DNA polymerase-3 subunit delta